ncbi:MAG: alternative ribosome rescue aminoacyl-tRNA hydrolase ArfB [Nitriliruptorales bacterium]|nr:alternative ribosome rescue aminoacyl-tRNA hydrolase ArfB [Nitriliruptorales bacterium]
MEELRVDDRHRIPGGELELRAARASGPGGQGVNTTDSAVELRWDLAGSSAVTAAERERILRALRSRITGDGVLIVRASDSRSQWRNRQAARRRLAELVADALRPPKTRVPTRPSRRSKQRRLDDKKRRSETKRLRRRPEL